MRYSSLRFMSRAACLAVAAYVSAQDVQLGPAQRLEAVAHSTRKEPARRAAGAVPWIDTTDRQAVVDTYGSFALAGETPIGFTGNVNAGVAGDVSAAYRNAVLQRINWFRRMAGVPDVTALEAERNRKSQLGALMIAANGQLSHTPPTTWRFYTADGAEALSMSNICYTSLGADPGCVALYMQDHGAGNQYAGHRRWLLFPVTDLMGTGDVIDGSNMHWNAVWVFPASWTLPRPQTRSEFVAWPPPGYAPYQTVWPRWSFSLANADFRSATVTMTKAGAAVPVRQEATGEGYGDDTLVWVPNNAGVDYTVPARPDGDTPYDVTIRNVLVNGIAREFTYRVIVFDPMSAYGRSISGRITKDGSPLAGATVTLAGGPGGSTFTDTAGNYSFSNLPAATSYTVTPSLVNHVFSPPSATVSNPQGATTADFTASQVSVAISGRITRGGQPLAGVNVVLSGGGTRQTDANGYYSFVSLPAGANYTITPSYAWHSFTPPSASFANLRSDRVADFGAVAQTFTITGTVLRSGSLPLAGVTVALSGGANATTLTNAQGTYSFSGVPAGIAYTVRPSAPGFTMTPASASIPSLSANVQANFSATAVAARGLRFVPITPCRVADTRFWSAPAVSGGSVRDFDVRSNSCGIPAQAAAYAVNLTVVPHGPLLFVTLWPSGVERPWASTLNALDGRIKANAAMVAAGTNGAVSVFASDTTDVILDVNGYFVDASDPAGLAFYTMTPCRIADTRYGGAPLGGPMQMSGEARSYPVKASACGVPAAAQAYSLNVTVVPAGYLGYLTISPAGRARPVVSTLNAPTGAITANAAVVPAGTNGAIDVFTTHASHVIVDINGYFAPAAAGGLSLYPRSPCRVLDTRYAPETGPSNGTRSMNSSTSACALPVDAGALVFNATVVPQGNPPFLAYLTLWQQTSQMPVVSTLNAFDGALTSNMAIVPATSGTINIFTTQPAHLIMDNLGYFAP